MAQKGRPTVLYYLTGFNLLKYRHYADLKIGNKKYNAHAMTKRPTKLIKMN